jgi:hypothetical protein
MADNHEKEIDGLLRKIPFFAGLSETERADVGGTLLLRNFRRNDFILHLVALRRSGGISTLDTMNHFFLAGQMIIVGRGIAFGREIAEVEKDDEGMRLVKLLGQRMAWLLKTIS